MMHDKLKCCYKEHKKYCLTDFILFILIFVKKQQTQLNFKCIFICLILFNLAKLIIKVAENIFWLIRWLKRKSTQQKP